MNSYSRLLHPRNRWKHLVLEELPIEIIDGIAYRTKTVTSKSVDSGSCQCYKDCDCSSKKGDITHHTIKWHRRKSLDNTEKCFYSIPK